MRVKDGKTQILFEYNGQIVECLQDFRHIELNYE